MDGAGWGGKHHIINEAVSVDITSTETASFLCHKTTLKPRILLQRLVIIRFPSRNREQQILFRERLSVHRFVSYEIVPLLGEVVSYFAGSDDVEPHFGSVILVQLPQ